jgi:hypothetical protein
MDDQLIDEETIRSYLLGRIKAENKFSVPIDERMLADPEFSLLIDVIADEILEEYVDGVLTAADVEAVEGHFLLPPERQRKLREMRLIRRHIAGAVAEEATGPDETQTRGSSRKRQWGVTFPSVRAWAEIAAGLMLAACTIYFWNQQRESRLVVEKSRQELAQWKQAQSGNPATAKQAAVVMMNLIVPGLSRGEKALPEAHLTSGVTTLHISIALTAQRKGRLRTELKQGDELLWFQDGLEARPVTGGAVLDVDVPASVVPEGTCKVIVTGLSQGEATYWFRVTKDQ